MYKFGQNGYRPDGVSLTNAHYVSSPAGDVMTQSSDPDVDRDECSDETDDIAAPLPTEDEVMSRDHGWGNRGGRLLAKDKRKLREKRRSTGVVKYTGHESGSRHGNEDDDDDEDCDAETSANTSLNETPSVNFPSKSPSLLTVDQSLVVSTASETTMLASSSNASPVAVVTKDDLGSSRTDSNVSLLKSNETMSNCPATDKVEPKRGILTSRSNPIIAPKPRLAANILTQPSTHRLQMDALAKAKSVSELERVQLNNRIAELEKLLDAERKENSLLRDELSFQKSKVVELEHEVTALNQDLDLADEDFTKLDEENRVLLNAMSKLHSSCD